MVLNLKYLKYLYLTVCTVEVAPNLTDAVGMISGVQNILLLEARTLKSVMIYTTLYSTAQNKKKEIITGEIEKEIHTTFCIRERELHTLLIFKGSSATLISNACML